MNGQVTITFGYRLIRCALLTIHCFEYSAHFFTQLINYEQEIVTLSRVARGWPPCMYQSVIAAVGSQKYLRGREGKVLQSFLHGAVIA